MLNFNAIYLYFSIFIQYIMLVQQIEIMQVFLWYLIKRVVEGSSLATQIPMDWLVYSL